MIDYRISISESKLKKREEQWADLFCKYDNNTDQSESLCDISQHSVRFIEVTLNTILIRRISCKILESIEYDFWHKQAVQELSRLNKLTSSKTVDEYLGIFVRYVLKKKVDPTYLEYLKETKLSTLLAEKEVLKRDQTKKDLFVSKCIELNTEWQSVIKKIPEIYVIKYAIKIISNYSTSF